MPAGPLGADPFARHDNRQAIVVVSIAIGNTAAVDDHRMVEQGPVAVIRGAELVQEAGEKLHVVDVDPGQLGKGLGPA